MKVKLQVSLQVSVIFCFQVFSNGDDQLEKAMEELLRDSEKDQNNFTALQEGSSDASSQAAQDGSTGQTYTPSLHLALDPSTTGIAKVFPKSIMHGRFFSLCSFRLT